MATQQNSTLIDDNLDTCPSLLNLPESPILPPKHQQCQNQDKYYNTNKNNNEKKHNKNNNHQQHHNHKAHVSYKLATNTYYAYEERAVDADLHEQQNQRAPCKNKQGTGNGSSRTTAAGRRHRSISLYGVNSTVEQGHKEIPIWLDDEEPRFVSGVTNKTTCNDIIKALIDDELRNCNNNNHKSDGGVGAAAASRDYSDYVITESWRGIERSYDGNMAILPVWRAWSRVHNELRLSLKHRKNFIEPLPVRLVQDSKSGSFFLFKWLKKLFRLKNTDLEKQTAKVPNKTKEKCLLNRKQHIPDELLLVLLPEQLYAETASKPSAKAKLYKLAETRATQRRRQRSRIRCEPNAPKQEGTIHLNNNNCIRRRRKDVPLRSSIRQKLTAMHAEMNERYEREYNLTRQLSEKCRLYKLQNERYTTQEMELSVGQLQCNIEAQAEDIIKTEHELLELKNAIKQDISLINNLKRMTLDAKDSTSAANSCGVPVKHKEQEVAQVAKSILNLQEMQFVDNIYEFCDNNASMLV